MTSLPRISQLIWLSNSSDWVFNMLVSELFNVRMSFRVTNKIKFVYYIWFQSFILPFSHWVPVKRLSGHSQYGIFFNPTWHLPPFKHFIKSHGSSGTSQLKLQMIYAKILLTWLNRANWLRFSTEIKWTLAFVSFRTWQAFSAVIARKTSALIKQELASLACESWKA